MTGFVRTNDDGERYIEAGGVTESGGGMVEPLGVANRAIGGGDWRYRAGTGEGQRGLKDCFGLNNIGLLVKAWGRVTASGTDPRAGISWFYLDDGSGVRDGTGVLGVYCEGVFGITPPQAGSYARVVGISGCEYYKGSLVNVIRVSGQEDISAVFTVPTSLMRAAASTADSRPRDASKLK